MRSASLLALALLLLPSMAVAEDLALKPDDQRKLDQELKELRSTKEPVLQLTPLQHIVDLGPAAVQAALPDIWALLDSPNSGVRKDALNALHPPVKLSTEQLQRLDRMIADPDDQVRTTVRKLIEDMRAYRDKSAAEQGLAAAEQMPARQLLAELAIEKIDRRQKAVVVARKRVETDRTFQNEVTGNPASVIGLGANPDPQVRATAMLLLAKCWKELPPEAMDVTVEDCGDDDEGVATAALNALGHAPASGRERAEATARSQAEKGSPAVRGAALAALGALGVWDDSVAKAVKDGLQGMEPAVWKGACAAIVAERKRQPTFTERLSTIADDPSADAEVRAQALEALGIAAEPTKSVSVLEHLAEAKTEDKRVRIAACKALNGMGADAVPALTTLQGIAKNDRDDLEVRKAAKAAAETIGHH